MYKDGYENITNIDISSTVIAQMKERYKDDFPNLKCTLSLFLLVDVMDARKLTYAPASFDMVVDKGTLDSILVWTRAQLV